MTAEQQIAAAEEILRSHGIEMEIVGCGCCGSPGILMRYKGVLVADTEAIKLNTRRDSAAEAES